MDFDWSLHNNSYLEAALEILAERKTFLNFDENRHFILFRIILVLKCIASGYGMVEVVPKCITYIFLFLQVFVKCLVERWFHLVGEMLHAAAHTGVLLWLHEGDEFVPSLPNNMIWYFYTLFPGAEFFLDCFVIVTLLAFIWKSYSARPHRLSLLICALYTVDWLGDQFVKEGTSSVFKSLVLFYLPVILMEAFNTTADFNLLPDAYVAIWMIFKISSTKFEETPAAMYKESVEMHFKNMTFMDSLEEFSKRKSFLNVDENEHYVVFNLLLLLKSFMASYAVKNIVGLFTTLKMMVVNCIFTILDRNIRIALAGLLYFILIAGYQFVFYMQEYSIALNSGIWFWVSCDNHFHFFLDMFLIVSALIYIDNEYEGDLDRISTLMCFLFAASWLSDRLTGESICWIAKIVTLYLPVLLISATKALTCRYRILLMVVFASLWIVFRLEREYFEHFLNEFNNHFYEISKAYAHLNDVFYH